jgi:alcohol dehydrogenase class IV
MRFDFATATEIVFGRGRVAELGTRARTFGTRALLVRGSRPERSERARQLLADAGVVCVDFSVVREPTTALAELGVARAREASVDLVIGLGGGSVLDAAKAVAGLAANGGEPLDYLEVVGRGRALAVPSLPLIAVPTTAGTGSEVTKNAVLEAPGEGGASSVKVSLRSPFLLPRVALVDPELTHEVPPDVTAATGLDALTQVLEPYVSNAHNPLTDALCLEGLQRGARSLLRAYRDGQDADAREDLSITSLFGGLALANAKLGAVHGFAGPLGGALHAPHGALCARLLPEVMSANLRVLRTRADSATLERYRTVARTLTERSDASAEDGVTWAAELVDALGIPRLSELGLERAQIPDFVRRARAASSMKGNPVELPEDELTGILERAL